MNAIVDATENATNTIMEATEESASLATDLRQRIQIDEVDEALDKIVENSNKVFEACTFQDITGQRISKIVKTMTCLKARCRRWW